MLPLKNFENPRRIEKKSKIGKISEKNQYLKRCIKFDKIGNAGGSSVITLNIAVLRRTDSSDAMFLDVKGSHTADAYSR